MNMELIECLLSEVRLSGDYHGFRAINRRNWILGDLLIKTNDLSTHEKVRNIGDKTFGFLVDEVQQSKEYQYIRDYFSKGI